MASASSPLIELKRITKEYVTDEVKTPVLFDIDLEIQSGELIAIMGPSGSGKSTLMHILGFLDTVTTGTYRFHGRDVSNLDGDALADVRSREVGFVFQAFNLLPRTTVLDNVKLPLLYRDDIKEEERTAKSMRAIAAVGLTERSQHLSNQLSGGQQQRVAIARALVTDPHVLFADEPTGNLDSASGLAVLHLLQELHASRHTIVLVTHERSTAEHAERIVTIRDGRIAEDTKQFRRTMARDRSTLK